MKIEVEYFKNLKKYANVVYLLDRADFLQEVKKIRLNIEKISTIKLPIPWVPRIHGIEKIWKPLTHTKKQQITKAIKKASRKYYDAAINCRSIEKERHAFEKAWRLNPYESFWLDVIQLRKKYKQYVFMEKIIAKAIIHGEIREEDYIDTYATILYQEREYPFLSLDPVLCIILTPTTQYRDIQRVFKEDIKILKKEYQSLDLAPKEPAISKKMKTEIIRDREWYWLWKEYEKKFYKLPTFCPFLLKAKKIVHNTSEEANNCFWCRPKKRKYRGEMKEISYDYSTVTEAVDNYNSWLYSNR